MTNAANAAKTALAKTNGKNGASKAPATLAGMKSTDVLGLLSKYEAQLANVLPKHLTPDRMLQIATTLIMQNKEIANCTTQSLVGALIASAMLGLEPTPQLGLCYFVPFKKQIQFIIGYKGMIQLARNSGQVETVYAQAVYQNDKFSYSLGLNPTLDHVPFMGDRGPLVYAYAVMKYKGGGYNFEVMSKDDIDKIRKRSAAGKSSYSPWSTDYHQMAKKTVIRQLFKTSPVSVEVQKHVVMDGATLDANRIQKPEDVNSMNVEYADAEVVETVDTETGEVIEDPKTNDMMLAIGELSKQSGKLPAKTKSDFEAWYTSEAKPTAAEIEYWFNTLSEIK